MPSDERCGFLTYQLLKVKNCVAIYEVKKLFENISIAQKVNTKLA